MQDIDKTKQALIDGLSVYQDVEKALEDDGKVSLIEGSALVIKHGGKALRLISAINEIGKEIADIDGNEAKELVTIINDEFGGNDEIKQAIANIALGSGLLNQGIQTLIKSRNE